MDRARQRQDADPCRPGALQDAGRFLERRAGVVEVVNQQQALPLHLARVKPHVRAIQQDDGVLILDDSIAEKPYTDENDIICWHYDHTQGRSVKGINFLTALYHAQGVSLPVGVTLIAKTEHYVDKKDGKTKRRFPRSLAGRARRSWSRACGPRPVLTTREQGGTLRA